MASHKDRSQNLTARRENFSPPGVCKRIPLRTKRTLTYIHTHIYSIHIYHYIELLVLFWIVICSFPKTQSGAQARLRAVGGDRVGWASTSRVIKTSHGCPICMHVLPLGFGLMVLFARGSFLPDSRPYFPQLPT